MKKRFLSCALAVALGASMMTGCGSSKPAETTAAAKTEETTAAEKTEETTKAEAEKTEAKGDFVVGMVTDTGGVNDQSFNQSSWEGLQALKEKTGAEISYLESTQESDYVPNLDKQVEEGKNLVWGIGFSMSDSILEAAEMNPDVHFAIIDNAYENTPENVTGVVFDAQDPSFMVGYAAALTSTTGKIGFVGGISSNIIDQFEYGYRAGAAYASKELGKEVTVDVQYAESFSDSAKGKAIATKMFSDGCDIVFHAAGNVGVGVIEAAKEAGKFAIGVDRDQAYLAPENVLTSALKKVNIAMELVSEKAMNGENIGGQTFSFGLKDGAVGIPDENPNMDPEVYKKTLEVQDKIASGEIVAPYNEETFNAFK